MMKLRRPPTFIDGQPSPCDVCGRVYCDHPWSEEPERLQTTSPFHTPWRVEDHTTIYKYVRVLDATGDVVCGVDYDDVCHQDVEKVLALLRAAPRLLTACEEIEKWLSRCDTSVRLGDPETVLCGPCDDGMTHTIGMTLAQARRLLAAINDARDVKQLPIEDEDD